MIDVKKNREINEKLKNLYDSYTSEFLKEYTAAFLSDKNPPDRINEFGIIDESLYDADCGILVIAKETNHWDNKDFEEGTLFRTWLQGISREGIKNKGHVSEHPTMWYNIIRWVTAIQNPELSVDEMASIKSESVEKLGTIAFTNINKVRGGSTAKKEYYQLAKSSVAKKVLKEEIAIIKPAIILCCGTGDYFNEYIKNEIQKLGCNVICMPHPAARKNKKRMIEDLILQLKNVPLN